MYERYAHAKMVMLIFRMVEWGWWVRLIDIFKYQYVYTKKKKHTRGKRETKIRNNL